MSDKPVAVPFNLQAVFRSVSDTMLARFRMMSEVSHHGGRGAAREDILREFLGEYLPERYAIGTGDVLHWMNRRSRQTDVVLYDRRRCPRLLIAPQHSVYPCESVYGTLEIKSDLNAEELRDGFEKVASVKRLISGSFTLRMAAGAMAVGLARPMPFGAVVAFASSRSLEAVLAQAVKLDQEFGARLSPDAIVVLDKGLVARPKPLRVAFNGLDDGALALSPDVVATGKHTLMRFYLQMVRELNTIELEPLELERYMKMPDVIGEHRVWGGGPFLLVKKDALDESTAWRLGPQGVKRILDAISNQAAVRWEDAFAAFIGTQMRYEGFARAQLDRPVRVYNPQGRKFGETTPIEVRIDDEVILVDLAALDRGTDFVKAEDVDIEEVFGLSPGKKGAS